MAIALPLIVQIFSPLQSAVEWLAGGAAPEAASVQRQAQGAFNAADPTLAAMNPATPVPSVTVHAKPAETNRPSVLGRRGEEPTEPGSVEVDLESGQDAEQPRRRRSAGTQPEGSRRRPTKSWSGPIRTAYTQACAEVSAQPAVRVVRDAHSARSRSDAGRMVIAGRLADVCAELDRLVALDTAH